MKEIHHLTLQDRQTIEEAIKQGKAIAEIGRLLGKDPAGISREIKRHREFKARNSFNRPVLCENRRQCKKRCPLSKDIPTITSARALWGAAGG